MKIQIFRFLLLTVPAFLLPTEQRRDRGARSERSILDPRMVATPLCAPPEHMVTNPSPSSAQETMNAELVVDLLSDSLQLFLLLFGCVVVFSLDS